MKMTVGSSTNTEICPPGTYPARIVRIIELGTQTTRYSGQERQVAQLSFGFEVLDQEVRRRNGEPYILNRRFTKSLHEKASLAQFLVALRGRPLSDGQEVDFNKLAGQYALITVTHASSDMGAFANIATITALPRGMAKPPSVTEPLAYFIGESPDEDLALLPESLQNAVRNSPEYQALQNQPATAGAVGDMDDDIPF